MKPTLSLSAPLATGMLDDTAAAASAVAATPMIMTDDRIGGLRVLDGRTRSSGCGARPRAVGTFQRSGTNTMPSEAGAVDPAVLLRTREINTRTITVAR